MLPRMRERVQKEQICARGENMILGKSERAHFTVLSRFYDVTLMNIH